MLASLRMPCPDFDLDDALKASAAFGLSGRLKELGGERDRNFLLSRDDDDLLIKVTNAAEPDELVRFQNAALRHIEKQDPSVPVPRLYPVPGGEDWLAIGNKAGVTHRVRVLSFLPGLAVREAPDDPRMMQAIGSAAASLDKALRGFFHPAADHPLAWDIKNAHRLDCLREYVGDDVAALVNTVLDRFAATVLPVLPGLRAQVIHNDIAFHNTVVDPQQPQVVTGFFDFGDMIFAPLVQELATSAADVAVGRADPVVVAASLVAGYHSVQPLEPEELAVLPDFIATRSALAIAISAWRPLQDERDHLGDWDADVIDLLKRYEELGSERIQALFRNACGLRPVTTSAISSTSTESVSPASASGQATDDLLQRRRQSLADGEGLSYDRPLYLVRGQGVWLYDVAGRAYLDCYNNVPHVGHCHPLVVEAIARQAALLNTNTRYLYDAIVEYSERITATLPDGLDVCVFVSSGSEANDLAWRMARACSEHSGALVMERAYHGVTEAVYDLSPYDVPERRALAAHVATLAPPYAYRGEWGEEVSDRGARYAGYVEAALQALASRGHAPAAFIMDSILSSNGIIAPPPGYLQGVYERVRAAGGLCVADEVQSGFGRMGEHMWGFEIDGVVPDIVTFGKPIGNGHPLGLVVTTHDIAERFAGVSSFFSTTGGNPVSCRAALAVLEVMEREGLQENARRLGIIMADGIRALANKHTLIGDVRGAGLFLGVELVRDRRTKEPADTETSLVINGLREMGVLIGREGHYDNVLKIRPPIVINDLQVELFLKTLDEVMSSL
jgi:4-aminobutyrate aminotransferase-like enzyme/Ser/Thr protein kinase RdoA (MazF antagonist)